MLVKFENHYYNSAFCEQGAVRPRLTRSFLLWGSQIMNEIGAVKVKKSVVTQSYPTLCYHMDCSPPGFSVPKILQARILEWIAIPFFRGSSQPRVWTRVSCIAGRFFIIWATRDAQKVLINHILLMCIKEVFKISLWSRSQLRTKYCVSNMSPHL